MSSYFILIISGFSSISIDAVGGPNNFFERRSKVIYTTFYSDITEDEKEIIRKIFERKGYNSKSLFLKLMDSDVYNKIENYDVGPFCRADELFYRALTMSLLLMKIKIQVDSEIGDFR